MEEKLVEVLDCKYHIAMRWIRLLCHGYSIPNYFESNNINSIIIYGITDFALSILDEYRSVGKLDVVKAISDRKITSGEIFNYYGIPCISPDSLSKFANQDTLVIVTPMGWHKEIKYELENYNLKCVVTIQELIYDMCSEMRGSEMGEPC